MPELRIVNAPQELVDLLDTLTARSEYHDRSAFVVSALTEYCFCKDNFITNFLPDVTRILMEESVKKEAKKNEELLRYTLNITEQFLNILSGVDGDNDEP